MVTITAILSLLLVAVSLVREVLGLISDLREARGRYVGKHRRGG